MKHTAHATVDTLYAIVAAHVAKAGTQAGMQACRQACRQAGSITTVQQRRTPSPRELLSRMYLLVIKVEAPVADVHDRS